MKSLCSSLIIFGCLVLSLNTGFIDRKFYENKMLSSEPSDTLYLSKNATFPLEFPRFHDSSQVVRHLGYSLEYNENCEQALWVAYVLTKQETMGVIERGDYFSVDAFVKTGSATKADYVKSGFDRGHLAPAADMRWSEKAMDESFYFSNMSPQTPSFNRGVWKRLEEKVRDWSQIYDSILVVTGPVLNAELRKIGPNQVCVPEYYYKVILDFKKGHSKAIGFIVKNEGSQLDLQDFTVSIDSIERLTGIDFYWQFKDEFESKFESNVCLKCWDWMN